MFYEKEFVDLSKGYCETIPLAGSIASAFNIMHQRHLDSVPTGFEALS